MTCVGRRCHALPCAGVGGRCHARVLPSPDQHQHSSCRVVHDRCGWWERGHPLIAEAIHPRIAVPNSFSMPRASLWKEGTPDSGSGEQERERERERVRARARESARERERARARAKERERERERERKKGL